MEQGDAELVDRYRAGDVQALDVLVTRYRRQLFGYIYNMTDGHVEADEIFQETWLRAIKSIHRYRHGHFLAWLTRIARNLVIDRWRARKPAVSLDAAPDGDVPLSEKIPDGNRDPLDIAAGEDVREGIADAVAGLPVEQREVVLMRLVSGLSFKEIARIQRVSINTALARMQYALGKLRYMLGEMQEEMQ